jgi:hypothetical protein
MLPREGSGAECAMEEKDLWHAEQREGSLFVSRILTAVTTRPLLTTPLSESPFELCGPSRCLKRPSAPFHQHR